MPANLSAEAKGLWAKSQLAKTPQEKMKALEAFHSAISKHKGNEKLQAQVKRKIVSLKLELEEAKNRKSSRSGPSLFIQKEGAAQVAIIGVTGSGRSSLLASLTNARPEISSREFKTLKPMPGIMCFQDIQFQLVETPPLVKGAADGESWGPLTLAIARNADALLLMIDLSHESCGQLEMITEELEKAGLSVRRIESDVNISRTGSGSGIKVIISGHLLDGTDGSVRSILQEYGLTNISVTTRGRARLQNVEDAILESTMLYKPSVVIANKIDLKDSRGYLEDLKEYSRNVPIIPVSCVTRQGLNDIGSTLFERLRIVRVYTKEPNEPEHSPDPFVLKEGSTVADLALRIHTGLAKDLRYAKIWGPSATFDGEKVGPAHVLLNGDIVQIRAA